MFRTLVSLPHNRTIVPFTIGPIVISPPPPPVVLFRSSANFNASEKRRVNGNTVRVQLSIDSRPRRKKSEEPGGGREEGLREQIVV